MDREIPRRKRRRRRRRIQAGRGRRRRRRDLHCSVSWGHGWVVDLQHGRAGGAGGAGGGRRRRRRRSSGYGGNPKTQRFSKTQRCRRKETDLLEKKGPVVSHGGGQMGPGSSCPRDWERSVMSVKNVHGERSEVGEKFSLVIDRDIAFASNTERSIEF
jgi:hypothetical protein